jgi:hypothetical protein
MRSGPNFGEWGKSIKGCTDEPRADYAMVELPALYFQDARRFWTDWKNATVCRFYCVPRPMAGSFKELRTGQEKGRFEVMLRIFRVCRRALPLASSPDSPFAHGATDLRPWPSRFFSGRLEKTHEHKVIPRDHSTGNHDCRRKRST